MNDTRARILRNLRRTVREADPKPPSVPVRRFDWELQQRIQRFRSRMEAVHGEVHEVGGDWPQLLFELLRGKGGGRLLYGPQGPHGPELEGRWPEKPPSQLMPYSEPVEAWRKTLFEEVHAGFTGCRGAIAETGSLVLWPTPQEPRLLSLVPPLHFVLLHAGEIHSTFHAMLSAQSWADSMPTNALLISGPSKTADIEQTLAYGVHGPKELIVLIRSDR